QEKPLERKDESCSDKRRDASSTMESCLRLLLISCLIASSKATVHFKNSLILDEFDLSGIDSVSLDEICLANGCKVYVSSLKDAAFIDKLTFKPSTGAEVSFKSYAYDVENKTQQKIPYVVNKGVSVSIANTNDNLACGPIVIYAVSNAAPNFNVAGVYDVASKYRQEQALGKVVTVMGPSPFTVWASSPSDKMEASVYTTGFDIEDAEKCTEVFHSIRSYGIKYAVNGPITTLFFEEEVQMNVDFLDFFETELDLTAATFITSPGYIGCANAQVYHSSLYASQESFIFSADVPRTTRLEASLNTEDPLTLRLDADPELERNFTGSIADDSYTRSGEISATTLAFSYCVVDPEASFLVKFTDLGLTATEKTRRTMPPTTPTSEHPTSPTSTPCTTQSTTTPTTTTSGLEGASIGFGFAVLMTLLL
ncbi:hypothetical protein PRIPAC_83346, partial [Pristionchus pacificus]